MIPEKRKLFFSCQKRMHGDEAGLNAAVIVCVIVNITWADDE